MCDRVVKTRFLFRFNRIDVNELKVFSTRCKGIDPRLVYCDPI